MFNFTTMKEEELTISINRPKGVVSSCSRNGNRTSIHSIFFNYAL